MALVLLAALLVTQTRETTFNDPEPRDCGVRALFLLHRLEGQPTRLDDLRQALPNPTPDGLSMLRLKEASYAHGLALDGVRIRRADDIRGPLLVFLKSGSHGHFVVVRPVGHSGRLIQVIDPSDDVDVFEADKVLRSPAWTGLALRPTRHSRLLWMPFFAVILAFFLTLRTPRRFIAALCRTIRQGLRSGPLLIPEDPNLAGPPRRC